jgi:hypothetical protein
MIERGHPSLSVGAQCRLMSISRSSLYYAPQGETAMILDLMLPVDKQFLDTPSYGVRQMTWHLQNQGHAVNQKRIRRPMRLMRLMPIYQKPNTSRPTKGHKTYPCLLGGLRIDRPNQVWCADITYFWRPFRAFRGKRGIGRLPAPGADPACRPLTIDADQIAEVFFPLRCKDAAPKGCGRRCARGRAMTEAIKLSRGERRVLIFTLIYIAAFSIWFLLRGNYEFIIYIATMLGLIWLVGANQSKAAMPEPMLWAFTIWGLLHMAGGGVQVGGGVLYSLQLVPLIGEGELRLLKYDQVVHAYGFGVTAWLLRHLLVRHFPATRTGWSGYVFPALASMGLGTVNEIIEFTAVLLLPDTNVGGYFNTALDLVTNALGAVIAMVVIRLHGGDRS